MEENKNLQDPGELFLALVGWFMIIIGSMGIGYWIGYMFTCPEIGPYIFAILGTISSLLFWARCFPETVERVRCCIGQAFK